MHKSNIIKRAIYNLYKYKSPENFDHFKQEVSEFLPPAFILSNQRADKIYKSAQLLNSDKLLQVLGSAQPSAVGGLIKLLLYASPYFTPTDSTRLYNYKKQAKDFLKKYKADELIDNFYINIITKKPADKTLPLFIKKIKADLQKNLQIQTFELNLLMDSVSLLLTDSSAALNRIDRTISYLDDLAFLGDKQSSRVDYSQTDLLKLRDQLMNQMGFNLEDKDGRGNIPVNLVDRYRTHPLYPEYLKVLKDLRDVYKAALKETVRSSGRSTPKITDVLAALSSRGVTYHNLVYTSGLVDEMGNLYTPTGNKIAGFPAPFIRLNPKYDPKLDNTYVFQSRALETMDFQKHYTENYLKGKKTKKFSDLDQVLTSALKARLTWRSHLKKRDPRYYSLALLSELAYITSFRVGVPGGETKGERTFGLLTLKPDHFKRKAGGVLVQFRGKHGVINRYLIRTTKENKLLLDALRTLNDPLWTFNGKPVTYYTFVKYLDLCGYKGKPHGLRYIRGTNMARKLMAAAPSFNLVREAEVWFVDNVAKLVAEELQHYKQSGEPLWSTTVKNYIDPQIIYDWFTSFGFRPPKWVENIYKNIEQK
jgi:hypothetical protein